MEREKVLIDSEDVLPYVKLHDTNCLNCGSKGTIVKRPQYCIVCKSKNIEITERKVDATGWALI